MCFFAPTRVHEVLDKYWIKRICLTSSSDGAIKVGLPKVGDNCIEAKGIS